MVATIAQVSMSDSGEALQPVSHRTDFVSLKKRIKRALEGVENPTEVETQVKAVTPVLESFGWDRFSSRVRLEYTIDGEVEQRPDYMLLDTSGSPRIAVEAKPWKTDFGRAERNQIKTYMRVYGLKIGILTNGYHYWLYTRPNAEQIQIPDPQIKSLDSLNPCAEYIDKFRPREMQGDNSEKTAYEQLWVEGSTQGFYSEILTESEGEKLPKQLVWEVYHNYASKNGKTPVEKQIFWREMYEMGIDKENNKRSRAVTGEPGRVRALFNYQFTEKVLPYLSAEQKQHSCIQEMFQINIDLPS